MHSKRREAMDTCPDCGSPLIEIYKACRRVRTPARMCTVCHTLWFNGEKTKLPDDWDKKYPSVAKRAEEVSDKIVTEALEDNSFRARKYFERVFMWAFSEGFTRAYAIFRHSFREGRMKRIRELWQKTTIKQVDWDGVTVEGLSTKELEELSRLINLGKPSRKQPLSQHV
jgi:hypothetical protein